jgi:phage/plasmid-associated DNA primase
VLGSGLKATLKDVYERYEQWCEEGGERAETKRKFNARLTERGQLADRRSGPGGLREWHGLELLTKQNAGFAGKLTKPPGNDYNSSENNPTRSNGTESVSSSAASVKQSDEGHVGEAF